MYSESVIKLGKQLPSLFTSWTGNRDSLTQHNLVPISLDLRTECYKRRLWKLIAGTYRGELKISNQHRF